MNRRSFVQMLGGGAVGALTLDRRTFAAGLAQGPAPAPTTASELIRIGSNENPYGPGPAAIDAVKSTMSGANRYPGAVTQRLIDTLATRFNVPADHILLSGGSGDLLRAAVNAFTTREAALVTGEPSYEAPARQAQLIGSTVRAIPLKPDLRLHIAEMGASAMQPTGLVYICNPNNPASTAVPAAEISALIAQVARGRTYVLVDEAYFEYADLAGFGTAIPHALQNPNVIVVRTFSKIHGMAGMRVGYAIAQPATLAAIRTEHSSSGLSVMSLAAATASLLDTGHIDRQVALNRGVRTSVVEAFTARGYQVAESDANFIFVNVKRDARGFQEAVRAKNVAIGRVFPPLTTWARITIGTSEEMSLAMPRMLDVLGSPPAGATAMLAPTLFTSQELC